MDPGTAAWAAAFDAVASSYDQSGVPFFGPIAQGLADRLDVAPGERVVELGSGRGALTLLLALAAGDTGRVDAVDVAPAMVSLLRRAVTGLPQVRVELGDAMAPPLEPGRYDVAAASLVLFFMPDPTAALDRWRALLRSGGRAGVSTFCPWLTTWRAIEDVFDDVRTTHGVDGDALGPSRMPEAFETDAGVERLFTDAGFTDVRSDTRLLDVPLEGLEQWRSWSMATAMRRLWAGLPDQHHAEVMERVGGVLDGAMRADGRSWLQVAVRYTTAVNGSSG